MPLPRFPLLIAVCLLLPSCVVPVAVQSYSAADGSSQARYGVRCLYPTPLSSTELYKQDATLIQLDKYGVHGDDNYLSAAIVIESKDASSIRIPNGRIEIDSTEFKEPIATNAKLQWARSDNTERRYAFSMPMPNIPAELLLQLPPIEVSGQLVTPRPLILRKERRFQPTGLCQ